MVGFLSHTPFPDAVTHMSLSRPILRFLSVTVLVALVGAGVHALTPGYGVALSADANSAQTGASGCAEFNMTVRNTGSSPAPPQHRIALTGDAGDSGWTLSPEPPAQVTLPPGGESEPVPVGACPPAGAEDGASATITITATVSDDPGTEKATATLELMASHVSSTAGGLANNTTGELDGNDTAADVNGTGDTEDSPGLGMLAAAGALVGAVAVARRRRT